MIVWRLATTLHPPLTGEGGRKRGGRWNSIGVPLVYASEHLSLALVELLVHLESDDLPDTLAAFEVSLPDDSVEHLDPVPPEWLADSLQRQSRRFGDTWVGEQRSIALIVPSVVVPQERNVLVNPLHPRFGEVQIRAQHPFRFDPRLGS